MFNTTAFLFFPQINTALSGLLLITGIIFACCCYKQLRQLKHEQLQTRTDLLQALHGLSTRSQERQMAINALRDNLLSLLEAHKQAQYQQQIKFDQNQINSLKVLQESLQKNMADARCQITEMLQHNAVLLDKQIDRLNQKVNENLNTISQTVEKRLSQGFEKTNTIFTDIIKRLALIDQAQAKITQLSNNVVNLQSILSDKRSRGAFGEVQLNNLIENMLPPKHFSLQHTLSNGKRVDCLLFLPEPTGHIAIDAKFPLESYQRLMMPDLTNSERKSIEQQFRLDIKKHIQDIASKYIIPGETADGAMLFIPAESIFAEIHAHHPMLIEESHRARVWLASPTTLMAVLTTALAVLKDVATREQVHIIQSHLKYLGKDFERFQKRMENLARHIGQANADVEQVHKSSHKITKRFKAIDEVALDPAGLPTDIDSDTDK